MHEDRRADAPTPERGADATSAAAGDADARSEDGPASRPVDALVRAARERLLAAGVTGPDAELLAAWASGRTLGQLRVDAVLGATLDPAAAERFEHAIERRERREPLQHILGAAPFRHVELAVGPGVFTPRPETEVLVDVVLAHLRVGGSGRRAEEATGTRLPRVLDAGTGSGAIAITIDLEARSGGTPVEVVAVEASPAAFAFARRNVEALAPAVRLVHADVRELTSAIAERSLAVLVSNPPYVPLGAVPRDPEVHRYDPESALYSGEDGLDLIRFLAGLAARTLEPGGLVAIEHGEAQGEAVRGVLEAAGLEDATTHRDLTGRDRVTSSIQPRDAAAG